MFNLKKSFAFAALATVSALNVANAGVVDTFIYDNDVVVADGYVIDQNGPTIVAGVLTQTIANGSTDYSPAGDVVYTLDVTQNGNGEVTSANVGLSFEDGTLDYQSATLDQATLTIDYDFAGTWDLTDGNSLMSFYFDVIDSGAAGFDIAVEVTDSLGATETESLTVAGGQQNSREFLSFGTFDDVNFSLVSALSFTFTSDANADFTIGEIGTVPEPTSLAILGLGLLGFAASRKKSA